MLAAEFGRREAKRALKTPRKHFRMMTAAGRGDRVDRLGRVAEHLLDVFEADTVDFVGNTAAEHFAVLLLKPEATDAEIRQQMGDSDRLVEVLADEVQGSRDERVCHGDDLGTKNAACLLVCGSLQAV